jgi:ATP-binding protein involved in chromosome partitioning
MPDNLPQRIDAALARVRNNRLGVNVLEAEMVRDLATTTDGRVRMTLLLGAEDDATLVRDVRQAVEAVTGVQSVRVDVQDPAQAAKPAEPPAAPRKGRSLPTLDAAPAPKVPSAPTPVAYPHLGRVLAISSGKGGVGKSTVATNVAVALAKAGHRVALMDADIYGPNVPRMMGVNAPPPVERNKIQPLHAHGVKIISLGFLIERDQPAIWRGPIVMKIINQFLQDVEWGVLDYFIVDMPPGTGDAQLSLVQATHVHGAVIVTTPQEVSVGDALRGVKMFERVGVPVLGVVENMSYLENPETGKPIAVFGTGGGRRLADEVGVPLLGEIPLYPPVAIQGDAGTPIVVSEPGSRAARALTEVALKVAEAAPSPNA